MKRYTRRQLNRLIADDVRVLNRRFMHALDKVDKKRKMGRNMDPRDWWVLHPLKGSGLIHKGRKP